MSFGFVGHSVSSFLVSKPHQFQSHLLLSEERRGRFTEMYFSSGETAKMVQKGAQIITSHPKTFLSESQALFDSTLSLHLLTTVIFLSITSQRWGRMGRMEGGYRSPSIIWMIPLDATMLVLARWMPFSPKRISPWGEERGAPSVNLKFKIANVNCKLVRKKGKLWETLWRTNQRHLHHRTQWWWQSDWPSSESEGEQPTRRLSATDRKNNQLKCWWVYGVMKSKGFTHWRVGIGSGKIIMERRTDRRIYWWREREVSYHSLCENVVSEKFLKFMFGLEKEQNIIKNPENLHIYNDS